jgi:RHS repeat-associated protein
VPGPPVQFGPPVEPATVRPGEGFTGIGLPENDIFYFHPDHLGSTSYITTKNGSISQHVEYIAFGEVLFEEHSSSFKSPYLFNGKELDRETNLSYYGARYLDMKTSLWLSVDPLTAKFPSSGSYNYALQNPINLVDPTGMSAEEPSDPPKRNIYIVIPKEGETFKFDADLERNGWHGISATDMKEADTMLKAYLNGTTANNIVFEAHGGQIDYGNGTKSSGTRFEDSTKKITGIELCKFAEGSKTNVNKNAIESLVSIAKQTKSLVMLVCDVNYDQTDSFGLNLSDLAPKTTIFTSGDQVRIKTSNHTVGSTEIGRKLFDCDKFKCGFLNKPLTNGIYKGWTKYKDGAVTDRFKDLKLSSTSGNAIPIR